MAKFERLKKLILSYRANRNPLVAEDSLTILATWSDRTTFYILNGEGIVFETPLTEWSSRGKFYTDPIDWLLCRKYRRKRRLV